MSKQKQEIIPKAERVKRAQTKHGLNDQKKRSRESLTIANRNKDDEFYTYYEDIEKAVNRLTPDAFRGLSVLCPFDNPETSMFWRYFHRNFERLGLSKLLAFGYGAKSALYTGGNDNDVEDFEPFDEFETFEDFEDFEDFDDFDDFDVIATNPPFSLYADLLNNQAILNTHWLLIAPVTVTCREAVIEKMKGGRLRFLNLVSKFETPTGPKSVGAVFMTTLPTDNLRPVEPPKPPKAPDIVDQTHDDQPIYNFNKYADFLAYPKQANTYYAIPTTAMLKFDGTEPFDLIKKISPSINGKHTFARLLVRYTG